MKLGELILDINRNTEVVVYDHTTEAVVIPCRADIPHGKDFFHRNVRSIHIQNGVCVIDHKTDNLVEVDAISITI